MQPAGGPGGGFNKMPGLVHYAADPAMKTRRHLRQRSYRRLATDTFLPMSGGVDPRAYQAADDLRHPAELFKHYGTQRFHLLPPGIS